MAVIRPLEERDSKGNTIRVNPSIVYRQDQSIRKIVGRNDFQMLDNPDYHLPITAQVQEGTILFFRGTPETTPSRAAAKEISQAEVPAYIIAELRKHPIRIREARPTVYEVKIATIGDVEVTQTTEVPNDGMSVTIEPIAPDLTPRRMRQAAAAVAV